MATALTAIERRCCKHRRSLQSVQCRMSWSVSRRGSSVQLRHGHAVSVHAVPCLLQPQVRCGPIASALSPRVDCCSASSSCRPSVLRGRHTVLCSPQGIATIHGRMSTQQQCGSGFRYFRRPVGAITWTCCFVTQVGGQGTWNLVKCIVSILATVWYLLPLLG